MTGVVDSAKLRRELAEWWRELGKEEAAGSGVLRACAMTFFVVADSTQDQQELGNTLAELNHEYPSRTIVLSLHPRDSGVLDGRVQVTCWRPSGRRQQICCEQIVLEAALDKADQLEGVILGLLVPDLPVVMWSRCPELMSPGMLRVAHKLIVDGSLQESARKAIGILERWAGQPFALGDLAWTRITRWREIVTQVLAAAAASAPVRVREMTIGYAGPELPATAAYLAGWLTRSLPWAVEVRWSASAEGSTNPAMGRIRSVSLVGDGVDISVRRPPGVGVDVQVDSISTRSHFPLQTAAELLRQEISVDGRDRVFEESWRTAAGLLETA